MFIGYDTYKIGQNLGKHLSERVYKGNFIVLKGDKGDFNTHFLYDGANKYIEPMLGAGANVILNDYVPGWSAETAKEMVKKAVIANDMKLDAVLCPNDGLAGGAAAAVKELGLKNHVIIVGMDAELAAVKRLVAGTQDATVYMDLKNMASAAVDHTSSFRYSFLIYPSGINASISQSTTVSKVSSSSCPPFKAITASLSILQ